MANKQSKQANKDELNIQLDQYMAKSQPNAMFITLEDNQWNQEMLEVLLEENQKKEINFPQDSGNINRSKQTIKDELNRQLDEYMAQCISGLNMECDESKPKLMNQPLEQNYAEKRKPPTINKLTLPIRNDQIK